MVPCGHQKECIHSMWLLQHCNIRAMADLSQNLYSFASNATKHLKGVSYHALIHLNKNAASKQMMLLSLFLFLLYSNIVQLLVCFANLLFSFDIGQKSHVKVFRPHLNHILLGGGPFWFRTICVCVCCLMSHQDWINC